MPRPTVESTEIARISRPASQNSQSAELVVTLCTLAPPGAPSHVRPRYVQLTQRRTDGTSIVLTVRRSELPALLAALTDASRLLE